MSVQPWPADVAEREARIAHMLLTRHDHNPSDRSPLTRENCGACVLNGYVSSEDRKSGTLGYVAVFGPNYTGWHRVYVQARRAIPAKWRRAFEIERESGTPYAEALKRDIATYGLKYSDRHGVVGIPPTPRASTVSEYVNVCLDCGAEYSAGSSSIARSLHMTRTGHIYFKRVRRDKLAAFKAKLRSGDEV